MTADQKELLDRLKKLVEDSRMAGFEGTLTFDLDGILEFYERRWTQ